MPQGPVRAPERSLGELAELANRFNNLYRDEEVPSRGQDSNWLISIRNICVFDELRPTEGSCRVLFLCAPSSCYVLSSRILPPYSGQGSQEIDELVYQLLSLFTLHDCSLPIRNFKTAYAPWTWSIADADLGKRLCQRLGEIGIDEPDLLVMETATADEIEKANAAWKLWHSTTTRDWVNNNKPMTYRQCYDVSYAP